MQVGGGAGKIHTVVPLRGIDGQRQTDAVGGGVESGDAAAVANADGECAGDGERVPAGREGIAAGAGGDAQVAANRVAVGGVKGRGAAAGAIIDRDISGDGEGIARHVESVGAVVVGDAEVA